MIFGVKNEGMGPENAYFWDTNHDGLVKSHITRHSGESRISKYVLAEDTFLNRAKRKLMDVILKYYRI